MKWIQRKNTAYKLGPNPHGRLSEAWVILKISTRKWKRNDWNDIIIEKSKTNRKEMTEKKNTCNDRKFPKIIKKNITKQNLLYPEW